MKTKNRSSSKSAATSSFDKSHEKSGFEKFEDDLKGTIFNVLYVLLKDDETSHWKHIVEILIDFMQIYHFSFAHVMHFPWKSDHELHYLQTFLDFFQVPAWLGKLDLTTYLVFFYICIFIVCLVILDIFYVSYSFSKKKFAFVWPLQALRSVAGLFVTVLFLPFLETFTTMLHCHEHNDHQVLSIFPEYVCWHVISLIVALTYFESKSSSHDISARINSRADVFIILMKITLIYIFAFLLDEDYHWFVIAVLLILSSTAFLNFRNHWPYYSDKMNKFFCVINGIFLWANFVLFLAKLLEHTQFSGALQIYFLGLPLVLGLIIFDRDERVKLLLMNINNFQKGEEVALQIRYFLHLISTKDTDRRSAIILKGYIYHHEDTCPNADCQLKQYKQDQMNSTKNKKNAKKHSKGVQNQDNHQLLLQHAKNMYKVAIQKFPTCTTLKIQFAFFLMERMNKKQEALMELQQASWYNPPFDEQFVIYRYNKMSEDFGGGESGSHGGSSGEGQGGMDIVAKFAYESSLRQCQQHIEKSAGLHLEFWNYLRDDRPDIAKLNECGSKINQSIIMVESYWNQLQKLNSNEPKALKMYAKFLIEILNDKEGGQDLLSRVSDATNMKQNYYDSNNLHDDLNDMSAISQNGTPCIYVTGDNDKIGMVTNCNAGASRIFGYTASEIKNHNVEKLMPEMYAKNHSKVLDDALAKGPENIPNKERLVFARHKSGYIFPVWLQLKMVQNMQFGSQFIALFKIDKKIMSSNIAFVLINREKKIQGISSSCMKLMNLDILKMKKLLLSGVDVNQVAPSLFDNNNDSGYNQKQGGVLDWYLPDFDKSKREAIINSRSESRVLNRAKEPIISISNNKIQFSCQLNSIFMGELGEIGWYLKLEPYNDKIKGQHPHKTKDKERLKQPLFQFRYESKHGKFIRELKDSLYVDNAIKDPNFQRGVFVKMNSNTEQPKGNSIEEIKSKESDEEKSPNQIEEKEASKDKKKDDSSDDLGKKRKKWSRGIQIYRLFNGKFQTRDQDEEIKKAQQLDEERKKKLEDDEKNAQNGDVLKNNIKSRKALQMAINDKSTPQAIRNLRYTMNLVMLCLLGLAISEFTVINSQFKDINQNFNIIQQSYSRISEVQRIAYNVRSLVMINEGKLTKYKNYTTQPDFVTFLKSDIEEALNNLYDLQNSISLTSLSMSDAQIKLVESKSVNLYFKEHEETLKTLKFSLTEAVLQISSAIFTARHMNLSEFSEDQEDVFFITYNVYNDFLQALRESSKYYVQDLQARSSQKNELILILFLSSIGTLLITMAILFPVVSNVNMARLKVLSLFVDIPNYHVFTLANKCENFMVSFHGEHNEEIESEENSLGMDGDSANGGKEDENVGAPMSKRGGHKQPKNLGGSNKKFFYQFGTAVIIVMGYFIAMFTISLIFINSIGIITEEMNLIAQAEAYLSFAQNVQREMIYDPEKPILQENSFIIARDSLELVTELNQLMQELHFHNRKIHRSEYKYLFEVIYEETLCSETSIVKLDLIPFDCKNYLQKAPQYGLQTVMQKYFETLREGLKSYITCKEKGMNPIMMIDSTGYQDLYILQFRFISDSFRGIVNSLRASTNTQFQEMIDTKMALFIVFVILMIIAYLILWTPFVSKLNNEIWRTKSMLTIIPIEVILKIPRMQEFLHSQSFFTNKSSTATSANSS